MDIFRGRVSRGSYWVAALTLGAAEFLLVFIPSQPLSIAIGLIILPIWLLIAAARARDMGRSGWLGLMTPIPIVGWGVALWFGIASSKPDCSGE